MFVTMLQTLIIDVNSNIISYINDKIYNIFNNICIIMLIGIKENTSNYYKN